MLRDVSELFSFVTGAIPVQQPDTHHQQQQQEVREAAAARAAASANAAAANYSSIAMFEGWVQALEGWIYDDSSSSRGQQQHSSSSSSSRQPLLNDSGAAAGDMEADSFSLWDLRAAMFQACLPVTSHSSSSFDGQQASASTAAGGAHKARASPQLGVVAGGDTCGSDALKGAPDTPGKAGHHAGTDSGEAAAAASDAGSSGSIALGPAEAARMKRAIKTMAAHITALKRTVTQLKQENQRLRAAGASSSSGGGAPGHHHHHHSAAAAEDDAMLADAVQSLLADKSALQQELSRLTRHNAALQELLEYTAAAAAAGPSLTSPSRCSLDGAEEGSSAASSPAGEYAAAGAASGDGEAAAPAALAGLVAEEEDTAASGVVGAWCEQQQDEADERSSGSASCAALGLVAGDEQHNQAADTEAAVDAGEGP